MSVTAGNPLPNITTDTTTTTSGPDWYNSTLKGIANAGNAAMGIDAQGNKIPGFDPASMIAKQSTLSTDAQNNAGNVATGYKKQLGTAEDTSAKAATAIGKDDINAFLNPFTQDVVSNLANQSYQSTNSTVMPALQAAAAASGQTGSQRSMNANAGALAQIQDSLIGEQSKALQSGYTSALDAALKQKGIYNTAAQMQNAQAEDESKLGIAGGDYENKLGLQEQAQRQSVINQPQTASANAASALSSLKVPSTVDAKFVGPGQSGQYSPSDLSTVTSLLGLFAAGNNGTSAAKGFGTAMDSGLKWLHDNFPSLFTTSGTQNRTTPTDEGTPAPTDATTEAPTDATTEAPTVAPTVAPTEPPT